MLVLKFIRKLAALERTRLNRFGERRMLAQYLAGAALKRVKDANREAAFFGDPLYGLREGGRVG